MKSKKGCLYGIKKGLLYFFLVIISMGTILAVFNLNLPVESVYKDVLDPIEQIRIDEVNHLRKSVGNEIWPGWGDQEIPIVLYNESYVFLKGMKTPAAGWVRVPYRSMEGGEWEKVPGADYYRQPLSDQEKSPQAFIVEIGEVYASSMTTKEWSRIHLMNLIKNDLPNILKPVMPYRLFLNKFDSDWHIAAIMHESFHAFQAAQNYERVKIAENINAFHNDYPWADADFRQLWLEERQILARALGEEDYGKFQEITAEWLRHRQQRRKGLDSTLIEYEQEREWLEGLAKYAELKTLEAASVSDSYAPLAAMKRDSDFDSYQDYVSHRKQEIQQLKSDLGFSESIFYYSGWAQSEMLDRMYPDWKDEICRPGMYLDDLLSRRINEDLAKHN